MSRALSVKSDFLNFSEQFARASTSGDMLGLLVFFDFLATNHDSNRQGNQIQVQCTAQA
jgi:hypothetical protein